jgi:branched-chain amino acid transport system substrate-binding protein
MRSSPWAAPCSPTRAELDATDHWGYTDDTGVMLKVVNGDWKVE